MTYGWAILIILVVGVMLWQTGYLEASKNIQPGKRGFSQMRPVDWRLTNSGTFEVTLINDAGTTLVLSSVSVSVQGEGDCDSYTTSIPNMRPAQTVQVQLSGCPTGLVPGDYYRINATVEYANPASGINHMSVGIVWGGVEESG